MKALTAALVLFAGIDVYTPYAVGTVIVFSSVGAGHRWETESTKPKDIEQIQ